jgi:thioesterase domain-containing protein/acyl carrier protein
MDTDAPPNIAAAKLRDAPTVDRMIRLFEGIFDTTSIGPDDDFFALGGDSLIATSLIAGIERDFDVIIPMSLLLERPTPRQLTESVGIRLARERNRCLIAVRKAGMGSPLFCVHGMNGYGTFPNILARALPDRPVYTLRALGLMSGETPLTTVPEIAARYLSEVKATQPSGPYILFAHCATSMIAWEMVQQMIAAGDEVAGIAMADPLHNDARGEILPWLLQSGFQLAAARNRFAADATTAANDPDSELLNGKQRSEWVRRILRGAVGAYAPKPLSVPVLLMVAADREQVSLDPQRGLPHLALNLEALVTGRNHDAVLNEESAATFEATRKFFDRVMPIAPLAAT